MQKPNAKILTAILLATIILATFPLIVKASTGYIRINVAAPAPSPLGIPVPAGGNVNLNFGGVTWSGGQFYLILSTNGFSDTTGTVYSPTFDLVNLTDPVGISTYTNAIGSWQVGNNWVNGSIPLNIAGGAFFIKAFDGTATAVAVTDTSITVIGTLTVSPTSGPAGAALTLRGFAFGANALVNLTYYNTTAPFNKIVIANLVQADALGQFNYSLVAPDLRQMVTPAGDQPFVPSPIIFNANYTAGDGYNVTYNENPRGLKRVHLLTATNLFGNGTDTAPSRQVGQTMRLIGLNFYPGTASILWDGATSIGTVTVNATGGFDTSITIPTATVGPHWVVIQDAGVSFYTLVYVTPTLTLTPSSGPVGTNVTATGIGFSASVGTTVYNVTLTWTPFSGTPYAIAWALTDATGQFTTTFIVPHDAGGARTVVALTNVSLVTSSRDFTITPSLILTLDTKVKPAQPISLNNNASLVYAVGNGFDPTLLYSPNIDNNLLGTNPLGYAWASSVMPNATGDIVVGFIADGFSYGSHVISFYTPPTAIPAVWASFNVMLTAGDPTVDMLTQINQTVTGLSGLSGVNSTLLTGMDAKLSAINATVVAINGNVATISTSVGIIRANVTTITPLITSISNGVATVQTAIGTVQTSLSSIGSTISSVSGTMATISSDIGSMETSLSSINTKVTSIDGKTATIQTDLGTLQGTVTATDGKVATIQTSIGTLQADVSDVQTTLDAVPGQISTPIWIAVVLALIAAIAAIACLILMRRKIAG